MHWKIQFLVKKINWETEDVIETKDKSLQDRHRIIVGNSCTENNKKKPNYSTNFEEKKWKYPKLVLMGRYH